MPTYIGTQFTPVYDANRLNGELGAFYRNSGNQNAGTLPAARLSGTYGISISGNAATATSATSAATATFATTAGSAPVTPATTSAIGGVELATDAEVKARTASKFPDAAQLWLNPGMPKAVFTHNSGAINADMFGNVTLDAISHNVVANTVTFRVSFTGLPSFTATPRNYTVVADAYLSSLVDATRVDNNTLDIQFAYWNNGLDAGLGSYPAAFAVYCNG